MITDMSDIVRQSGVGDDHCCGLRTILLASTLKCEKHRNPCNIRACTVRSDIELKMNPCRRGGILDFKFC